MFAYYFFVHEAWYAALLFFGLCSFVWLHIRWTQGTLRALRRAAGFALVVSAPVAGAFVWTLVNDPYIVWFTYGLHFLYGLGLLAFSLAGRGERAALALIIVAASVTVLSLPENTRVNAAGLHTILAFCSFLWVCGLDLQDQRLSGLLARALLPLCLAYYCLAYYLANRFWVFEWMYVAAFALTELRIQSCGDRCWGRGSASSTASTD